MVEATSSGRTNRVAASKESGCGSSELTFQPPANQRNSAWARRTAASRAGAWHTGSWPTRGLPVPPCRAKASRSPASRSVAITRSARRPPVGVVAHRELAHPRLARAAVPVEGVEEPGLRLGGDHQVGEASREGAGALAGDRETDRGRLGRQVPQPGRLHVEVRAAAVDVA